MLIISPGNCNVPVFYSHVFMLCYDKIVLEFRQQNMKEQHKCNEKRIEHFWLKKTTTNTNKMK